MRSAWSLSAQMPQWNLSSIKSTKAIRPYDFKVTVPPRGGTPNSFEGVVAEGRLFFTENRRPFFV